MLGLFNYILPKTHKKPVNKEINTLKKVYVVFNKNTNEALGVYDSLEKAKNNGQESTFYNCSIIEFEINKACKYLNNIIFENE